MGCSATAHFMTAVNPVTTCSRSVPAGPPAPSASATCSHCGPYAAPAQTRSTPPCRPGAAGRAGTHRADSDRGAWPPRWPARPGPGRLCVAEMVISVKWSFRARAPPRARAFPRARAPPCARAPLRACPLCPCLSSRPCRVSRLRRIASGGRRIARCRAAARKEYAYDMHIFTYTRT